ncbi:winged helix-turn-helix domain-containing protein [Polaromonas sp. SM01]|uniref:winged helix-turn-helix domain-containing protein n=1 Tax=Polaromonas sp. SM01 TaxID=3085630 RepID=UPI0029811391|nr:winged helix-turn-helix domain-containing protein [Polaromonas sp. SM01]MDW5443261.1 winged helix-turn-helix domain-containing protein [Polaromonas sp. SM01]
MMRRHFPDKPPALHSPAEHGYTARDDGFVCLRGLPLQLPPKERAVLHLLLSCWPDVVPKEVFANRIWRNQPMSDESLARCVAQLRPALSAQGGLGISAVYRTGYRLTLATTTAGVPVAAAIPPLSRLHHEAMAQPRQVATLLHARQLTHQRTGAGLVRAQALLRELITQAPDYLAAKLALAECMSSAVSCGLTVQSDSLRESLAQLRLIEAQAPDLPGLHAEMAHLLDCQWRFSEARDMHERAAAGAALDDQALHYLGWHQLCTGQAREAAESLQLALELNPFSVTLGVLRARCLTASGELQAGLTQAEQVAHMAPDNLAAQVYLLGYQAFLEPRTALLAQAEQITLGPGSWPFAASTLAYLFARCGAPDRARGLMAQSADEGVSMRANHLAVLLCLGELDQAMALALAAARQGCGQLPLIINAPENAGLRQHPDFARLHALMGTH